MRAEILSSNRYLTVSTVDENGNPWAAPVWYVCDDDGSFYWWSPIASQHSKNIANNSNVYITIFNSQLPEGDGLGLYFQATASELPEGELDRVIELYNSTTKKFTMSRENCSGSAPTRLYKATPSKTWYNDGLERESFYTDVRKEL
jgi:uncharacterized protein YhbP (UPF0306 family)